MKKSKTLSVATPKVLSISKSEGFAETKTATAPPPCVYSPVEESSYFVLATDGLWDNMDLNSIYAISCDKVEGMELKSLDQRA